MKITTTLVSIRKYHPCIIGWETLLHYLGKNKADDEPLDLLTILNSNGLEDALWCFRALGPEHEAWARLTICDLVQPVMKYTDDPRPQKALDAIRATAEGDVVQMMLSLEELKGWKE
jgi:hypothetical protein